MKSFVYAARGVARAVREERNLRFHLCTAVYVYAFSAFYTLSAVQYALLTVLVCAVLAMELVNTALENVVNGLVQEKNQAARNAKDAAAAAVLVLCAGAVVCGFLLFWNTAVFRYIIAWFAARWWMILLLAASLAGSVWFVFFFGNRKDNNER
ncbi:diacylglycerol kinase family protein [Ruminococcaceae bacterium OttesenSCG-928-O06]|nr:diacylglycerol kinase family protein [Ruminococcaceae bacterium OttesenSCG-928-O06]